MPGPQSLAQKMQLGTSLSRYACMLRASKDSATDAELECRFGNVSLSRGIGIRFRGCSRDVFESTSFPWAVSEGVL